MNLKVRIDNDRTRSRATFVMERSTLFAMEMHERVCSQFQLPFANLTEKALSVAKPRVSRRFALVKNRRRVQHFICRVVDSQRRD